MLLTKMWKCMDKRKTCMVTEKSLWSKVWGVVAIYIQQVGSHVYGLLSSQFASWYKVWPSHSQWHLKLSMLSSTLWWIHSSWLTLYLASSVHFTYQMEVLRSGSGGWCGATFTPGFQSTHLPLFHLSCCLHKRSLLFWSLWNSSKCSSSWDCSSTPRRSNRLLSRITSQLSL